MIGNYFKTVWRMISRKPVFSIINIVGLSIGLFCTLLLYLFVQGEFGYDASYEKADRIYRVFTRVSLNGSESRIAKSSKPIGPTLMQNFPEVETYTVLGYNTSYTVRFGDKSFKEYRVYTADSNCFNVFDLGLHAGNMEKALARPNHAVVTKAFAEKYFAKEDPVGKQLLFNDTLSIIVGGVMDGFPERSHFHADVLLSSIGMHNEDTDNWLGLGYSTFLVLKKGTDIKTFEEKIKPLTDTYVSPFVEKLIGTSMQQFKSSGNDVQFHLQPLKEVYLYSKDYYHIDPNTEWGHATTSSIRYIRIFMAVAFFVLVIAVFNFINLSTATSENRRKEVGIRKTLGSDRVGLIRQFLLEAIVYTVLAVLLAIALAVVALPWLDQLLGLSLSFSTIFTTESIVFIIAFVLVTGLLAGAYPAFFLSSFRPIETLKSGAKYKKGSLRSILVVGQFAISIALIIGMMVVRKQVNYLQELDMGFDKQNLLTITNGSALDGKEQIFKNTLLSDPNIQMATVSSVMFEAGVPESAYRFEGIAGAESIQATSLDVDENFFQLFRLKMLAGRFFDATMITDSQAVVVNESAMLAFKAKDSLNQRILNLSNKDVQESFTIIGVVKDFHFESLHQKVKPMVMHLRKVTQPAMHINIRYRVGSENEVVSSIQKAWQATGTSEKCDISFLADRLSGLYQNEKKVSAVSAFLSILAVFIASLGLFGLVMFVLEKRTKEIGIRKVLGASAGKIAANLSIDFLKLVLLSFLIGIPVAWYVASNWLQNYPYRVQLGWTLFAFAALVVLLAALVTVSFHALKAALANPVKSLRTE